MEDRRIIPKERGEAIAKEHGIRYMETSAKANINIETAFTDLAEAILNKQKFKDDVASKNDHVSIGTSKPKTASSCCSN